MHARGPMMFGLIVVGDEILSGKREDKHFHAVRARLAARGLVLAWVRYLGDDRARLTRELRTTFASDDVVLCCGGIGATPDDHTRQAAAQALGVDLVLHPQAREAITLRCAEMAAQGAGSADMSLAENRQRLRMGEFPAGAQVIPNPFNRIPGFSVGHHHFVPGFPVMAWPMIEWVLDTGYADQFHREPQAERGFLVFELAESRATPVMEAVEARHPGVRVYSLPSTGGDGGRRHIELGVKGAPARVASAYDELLAGILALGADVDVRAEPDDARPAGDD